MSVTDSASVPEPGLRERKKARTRRAIVRATIELTLEHGFAAATIPQIAERAEVAPRTVSLYFPHKEEIVFDGAAEALGRLVERLADGEGDLVDRLGAWLADESELAFTDDFERLRCRAISLDPDLRMRDRLLMESAEQQIAAAVADELGEQPSGIGSRAFAAGTLAVLASLRDQLVAGADDAATTAELDRGMAFLRSGLTGLRRAGEVVDIR